MYVEEMSTDLALPRWKGQHPWFEIYFAVLVDESRRRALWIRQSLFVPATGEGRATIWGAWFDADATPPSRATKRFAPLTEVITGDGDPLIRIGDSHLSRNGAAGSVEGIAWDATWSGGKPFGRELPAWLPAPTHARGLVHDADTEATVTVDGTRVILRGKALAMHLWGNRRVPTLHWIWAPWLPSAEYASGTARGFLVRPGREAEAYGPLGPQLTTMTDDVASLEMTAVSLRDRFSLGLSTISLDAPPHGRSLHGAPATAAHPHGLVTATVAGARELVHVHAWAEADQLVGYAYRDTDERDLMIAQSDIGSAHVEIFERKAPGFPWRLADERRSAGGVAVEIHQREPLPGVDYIAWDATRPTPAKRKVAPPRGDLVDWPELGDIVGLGLTYRDHAKETGQKIDTSTPPIAFSKHARTFITGDGSVNVPTSTQLLKTLQTLEPGLGGELAKRMRLVPAVMDYEGEIALVALGDIDESRLGAGVPQPFGLAACNDLTARICQVLGEGMPNPYDYWAVAKSFPRFLPVSDRVWAPADGIARMPDITIVTRVNGEERQRASSKLLAYDLPMLVRAARTQLGRPLRRGDVICTGTPAGIGMRLSMVKRRLASLVKDRFRKAELLVSTYATSNALLRPGDVVEVEAGPAGSVRTRLVV
jgi:2-keto-4-pentenoate hydratase/2-oxohepta-3-ene-1,7-dioic acid hydratase in catechol pathway